MNCDVWCVVFILSFDDGCYGLVEGRVCIVNCNKMFVSVTNREPGGGNFEDFHRSPNRLSCLRLCGEIVNIAHITRTRRDCELIVVARVFW